MKCSNNHNEELFHFSLQYIERLSVASLCNFKNVPCESDILLIQLLYILIIKKKTFKPFHALYLLENSLSSGRSRVNGCTQHYMLTVLLLFIIIILITLFHLNKFHFSSSSRKKIISLFYAG